MSFPTCSNLGNLGNHFKVVEILFLCRDVFIFQQFSFEQTTEISVPFLLLIYGRRLDFISAVKKLNPNIPFV